MPAAVPLPIREALFRASQQGDTTPALVQRFALSPRTVRHLLRQARSAGQAQAPHYHCPGPKPLSALMQQARALRHDHPQWGAPLIRIFLAKNNPQVQVPCGRTIQRWLAQAGLAPAPRGRPPTAYQRACQVHQRWQVDAADQMPLASGDLVSWLRLVDECCGAVLKTVVFPPGLQHGQRQSSPRLSA
jgi:hypothetical protein